MDEVNSILVLFCCTNQTSQAVSAMARVGVFIIGQSYRLSDCSGSDSAKIALLRLTVATNDKRPGAGKNV